MNTGRPMSISGWRDRHAARASATSGRSCSPACAVFFERDGVTIEEPPYHARHEAFAVGCEQMIGDLAQRDVGRRIDQSEDLGRVSLDPRRTPVTALRAGLACAALPPVAHQFDRRRWSNPKACGGRAAAHPLLFD